MNLKVAKKEFDELISKAKRNFSHLYVDFATYPNFDESESIICADISTFVSQRNEGLFYIYFKQSIDPPWWSIVYENFGLIRIANEPVSFYQTFQIDPLNMYLILDDEKFNYFILKHPELINKNLTIQSNE